MEDSKQCQICRQVKPLTAYYKRPQTQDKRYKQCKECHKKRTKEDYHLREKGKKDDICRT